MRIDAAALRWGVRRLLAGAASDIRAEASRSWRLCPPERAVIRPALHPERALERVTALSPWRDWSAERTLIAGGTVEHAAALAHLVEDVALSDGVLYRGAARAVIGVRGGDATASAAAWEEAHLISAWTGSAYFGPMLRDDFTLALIPPPDARLLGAPNRGHVHEAGYRRLLELPRPPAPRRARLRRLTLYTDYGQNSFKAARYRELRSRLRRRAPAGLARAPVVYLKRGATGERRTLANEAALEAMLLRLGADVVEPAAMDAETVAGRLLGAKVAIGVEGSHLAHANYALADDGAFLVLQPPDRFAMAVKEFADCLDLRFAFVVGLPAQDGFAVDLDEVRRILDGLT